MIIVGWISLIGDNIRIYRKAKGWSQEKLAQESGLAKISIGNYERGDRCPTLESLQKMAEALAISLLDLTAESEIILVPNTESKLKSYLMALGYDFSGMPFDDGESEKPTFIKEWDSNQFFSYEQEGKKIYRTASIDDIKNAFDSIESFVQFTMYKLVKNSQDPPENLDYWGGLDGK